MFPYFLVLLLWRCVFVLGGTCASLSNLSICAGTLPYNEVYIDDSTTTATIEDQLRTKFIVWDVLSPMCRANISTLMCSQFYPQCNTTDTSPILPCQAFCNTILSGGTVCDSADVLSIQKVGVIEFNCSSLPNNRCFTAESTFSSNPSTPYCFTYNGTLCSGINYEVYHGIPGVDGTFIEAALLQQKGLLGFAGPACVDAILAVGCSSLYPRCDRNVLSRSLQTTFPRGEPVFPSFPCNSVCRNASIQCATFAPYLPDIDAVCNSSGCSWTKALKLGDNAGCPYDAKQKWVDFPVNVSTLGSYSTNSTTVTLTDNCTILQGNLDVVCIFPLKENLPDPNFRGKVQEYLNVTGSKCELMCPAFYLFYDYEVTNVIVLTYFSIPSLIFLTLLMITFLFFPTKRKQSHLLLFFTCSWVSTVVIVMGFAATKNDIKQIGCSSQVQGNPMNKPSYCVFQAVMLFYFTLAEACWWLVIAVELFLKVVLMQRATDLQEKKKNLIYHALSWGMPLLFLIIFLSAGGQFGTDQFSWNLFCWILLRPGDFDDGIWFIPILFIWLVGAVLMLLVFRVVYKSSRATASVVSHTSWGPHIRTLVFITVFLAIYLWFFLFRAVTTSRFSTAYNQATQWVNCMVRSQGSFALCRTGPEAVSGVARWTWYGFHGALSLQGLVLTLIWGSSKETFAVWKNLFKSRFGTNMSQTEKSDARNIELRPSGTIPRSSTRPSQRLLIDTHTAMIPEDSKMGETSDGDTTPTRPTTTHTITTRPTTTTMVSTQSFVTPLPDSGKVLDRSHIDGSGDYAETDSGLASPSLADKSFDLQHSSSTMSTEN